MTDYSYRARHNVMQRRNQELENEIRAESYRLRYESEMLPVDEEVKGRIEELCLKVRNIPKLNRSHSMYLYYNLTQPLTAMLSSGKYHPQALEDCEYALKYR